MIFLNKNAAGGVDILFPISLYVCAIENAEERDTLTWIYENLLNVMLATAKKYVGVYQVEEGVVHNAILKIMDHLDGIDRSNIPRSRSYVCCIVKSCAIDWLRKNKRQAEADMEEEDFDRESEEMLPLDILVTNEGYEKLVNCIRSLPDTYRMVCELKFLHGMKEREIAQILQITEKNVSVRIVRGRRKLIQSVTEVLKK